MLPAQLPVLQTDTEASSSEQVQMEPFIQELVLQQAIPVVPLLSSCLSLGDSLELESSSPVLEDFKEYQELPSLMASPWVFMLNKKIYLSW